MATRDAVGHIVRAHVGVSEERMREEIGAAEARLQAQIAAALALVVVCGGCSRTESTFQ